MSALVAMSWMEVDELVDAALVGFDLHRAQGLTPHPCAAALPALRGADPPWVYNRRLLLSVVQWIATEGAN